MDIQELYERLSLGELSNLAVSNDGIGVMQEEAKRRIINYANEGLVRLHTRYVLRQNFLVLKQVEHLTYYYLLRRYSLTALLAEQNAPVPAPGDPVVVDHTPHHYILDKEDEPFPDDVIKVLQVSNLKGEELPLNDADNPKSLFTPQPNLLQVPKPVKDEVLFVMYQARHPEIKVDSECAEIDIPFALEGALLAYIGYKFYSHMNGQENTAKAQEHLSMYEGICSEITMNDIVSQTQSNLAPQKFYARGFV